MIFRSVGFGVGFRIPANQFKMILNCEITADNIFSQNAIYHAAMGVERHFLAVFIRHKLPAQSMPGGNLSFDEVDDMDIRPGGDLPA